MRFIIPGIFLLLTGATGALFAQGTSKAAVVVVPFRGCKSDGQLGPRDAPTAPTRVVRAAASIAQQLTHYETEAGTGVLAPSGWHCFGTYGSGGTSIFVSPDPIDTEHWFTSERTEFQGAAVQFSVRFGETSGRFSVAEVIARVFPSRRDFVTEIIRAFELPPSDFPIGPYPKDVLTYRSKTAVEFETPAHADGLGTRSLLAKGDQPISGAAILVGKNPPFLWQVSVRLPARFAGLASVIVRQVEAEAASADAAHSEPKR